MKRLFKKGDTLVEIMIAVGVFGMVAIGAISLMNQGLATSQNTLEITMARQEINTQIEALRFIHNGYISESKRGDSIYRPIWQSLTFNAYTADDESTSGILQEDEDFYTRTVENNTFCSEIYKEYPAKSFVINPRKLNDDTVGNDTVVYRDNSGSVEIRPAEVYPRLLYGGNAEEETLSDSTVNEENKINVSDNKTLYAAEGIWITAIASENGIQKDNQTSPDFYDFYVHTCWDKAGGNGSTTINSILRLYNPNQIIYDGRSEYQGYELIYDANGGEGAPEPERFNDITYPKHTFAISDKTPTREGYRFLGWSKNQSAIAPSFYPSGSITVHTLRTTLYAVWEAPWAMTLSYNANADDASLPDGFAPSETHGPTFDDSHEFNIPTALPLRTNYEFLGWAESPDGEVKYPAGGTVTLTRYDNTKTLYAKWKILSFTCNKQYRLQNADGSYPSSYTFDISETVDYGSTCSYTKSFENYVTQSTSATMGVGGLTLSLDLPRNVYTCTKQYRLENADGTWGEWIDDGTASVRWGDTCAYSKSMQYYNVGNGSITMPASDAKAQASLSRVTYTLTINRSGYISSVSGGGSHRWGQVVAISATPSSYRSGFTGWSHSSGTAGTFGNTSSTSTTYTMGKGNSTIYANGREINLQNFPCSSYSNGYGVSSALTFRDTRDGQYYRVVKTSYGKCWITREMAYESIYDLGVAIGRGLPENIYGGWANKSSRQNYACTDTNTCWVSHGYKYAVCPGSWSLPSSGDYSTLVSNYNLPDIGFRFNGNLDGYNYTLNRTNYGSGVYWVNDGITGVRISGRSVSTIGYSYYGYNGLQVHCIKQ